MYDRLCLGPDWSVRPPVVGARQLRLGESHAGFIHPALSRSGVAPVVVLCRVDKSGVVVLIGKVKVGSGIEERTGHIHMPVLGRQEKR